VIKQDWSQSGITRGCILKGFSYAIDQRPPFVLTENLLGGWDWVFLVPFYTPSILGEVRVLVLVAAGSSTNSGCMCLRFV
jgi:hypothetical protein